jgi:leucyl-tRNA synthetase
LPWDTNWVIESLSDSTIYMAYYTIAHFFHGNIRNLSGTSSDKAGIASSVEIRPEDLTDEVFSYIFLGRFTPRSFE